MRTHNYRKNTTKHYSTKSDEEIERLRQKYSQGVPKEIIYHFADKLADALFNLKGEECGEIMGKD